jgi:5'(3')-deoxyribonucleotidase
MPTIYLDMDGVLADFNTGARKYLNATEQDEAEAEANGRWPERSWGRLVEAPNFYRHLPKMPQADLLMLKALRFQDALGWRLRVLTAIPQKNEVPDVFQDKIEWMMEYYPGVVCHFGPYSHDKHRHCKPGDILVDDRASNCEEWRAAGGHAVKVGSDYSAALAQLDILFQAVKDKGSSQYLD